MKKDNGGSSELRRQAEQRLPQDADGGDDGTVENRRLHHELDVHRIELEIQNEELHQSRLEVEVALERYAALFHFAPVGYATLATDTTIREVNHAGARVLGRDRNRLTGFPFSRLIAADEVGTLVGLLDRVRASDETEACELKLERRDVEIAVRARRLTDAGGGELLILLAFEDITERKQREARLVRTEQMLRDVDRRKDEFLAALSHELRNPLAPIRNSLFVLARAEAGGDQAKKAHAVIDRQVTHLTRLVDDLLDVTRVAQGKIQLKRERVELGDLARRTMDDYHMSFEQGGIRLEGQFEPGLFWVSGDPARLIQALSNVLGNAEKFTPRGGTVTVGLGRTGGHVALRVRDNGVGIERELLDHVFESFVQAPQSMDRARGGLGLGLAMVKGLIEMHGGVVAIASDGHGQGTELTISLPLEAAPPRSSPTQEWTASPKRRRVLVIDDSADTSDSMKDGLELSGHEVQVAYDGRQGLEVARAFHPEIIVCDIGLPGMNGYTLAQAVRADEALRDIYLVAVSGYARPEDLQRASEAGFDKHLAKPIRLEKLARLIADAPATATAPPR